MTWLTIRPISAVSVRDGRGFNAGANADASVVFPRPTTAAGSVARAIGSDFASCIGPFPCRATPDGPQLLLPAPRDIITGAFGTTRCSVQRHESTDLALEALLVGTGDPLDGWLGAPVIERYLACTLNYQNLLPIDAARSETRVGLWREDGRTAADAYLYSAENLVFADDVLLAVNVEPVPNEQAHVRSAVVPFGGEARLAEVSVAEPAPTLPRRPESFPGGRVLLYLATPGVFPGGAKPPLPDGCHIVAAAVGGPEPFATMGIATTGRHARPQERALFHAVAAGSVYYLQFHGEGEHEAEAVASHWSISVHGKALRMNDPGFDRLATAGCGVVLCGTWSWPE